jgi:hypothetical protein
MYLVNKKLATIPLTVSRWGESVTGEAEYQEDTQTKVDVIIDDDPHQIMLEIDGVTLCFDPEHSEVLETAIRVARQTLRKR